jgi:hypothetical protein
VETTVKEKILQYRRLARVATDNLKAGTHREIGNILDQTIRTVFLSLEDTAPR